MRELALNILDIVMNSIEAKATRVIIFVEEFNSQNLLRVRIKDNGRGMGETFIKSVLDPFVTTRTTRSVGMGLSMFRQIARQCGGELTIESEIGKGTLVTTTFQLNNLNLPPIGQVADSVVNLYIGSIDVHFCYVHKTDHGVFSFDSYWMLVYMAQQDCQLYEAVGPAKAYIKQKLKTIKSKAM